jgi:hypothetical protein
MVLGCSEYEGIFLDYSRQQATIEKLLKMAEVAPVPFFMSLKRQGLQFCIVIWDLFHL